jgi:uncharacterized GH25 family protein
MRRRSLGLLFAALLVGGSFAHDFWIRPASFRPRSGEVLNLHLLVGDNFAGEPVLRQEERIRKFVVVRPDGAEQPVVGRPGDDPAGRFRPTAEGLYVVGYRSKNAAVELAGDKFEAYLREEGLDAIAALRATRGETAKSAKETYSRSAKALFRVGEGGERTVDRVLGFDLELIPERDPYARADDGAFPVRLRFREKPLANAALAALHLERRNAGEPSVLRKIPARTDADGRATFVLDRAGEWLIKCVHMIEAAPGSGFDYESFWASLTFEAAAAGAATRPTESRATESRATESRATL